VTYLQEIIMQDGLLIYF